jgi:hypothetical protein
MKFISLDEGILQNRDLDEILHVHIQFQSVLINGHEFYHIKTFFAKERGRDRKLNPKFISKFINSDKLCLNVMIVWINSFPLLFIDVFSIF